MDTMNFPLSEYLAILKLTDGCKRRVYYSKNGETSKSLLYSLIGLIIYYVALILRSGEIFEAGNFKNNLLLVLFPVLLFVALILASYRLPPFS